MNINARGTWVRWYALTPLCSDKDPWFSEVSLLAGGYTALDFNLVKLGLEILLNLSPHLTSFYGPRRQKS